MAKITAARRNKLPASSFALPGGTKARKAAGGGGSYPVDTKGRAVAAKARATQAVQAGRMSPSTKAKIDAKANRKLGILGR